MFFNLIDISDKDNTLKMANPAVFKSAEVVLGNLTNGAKTTYDFNIVTSTAIYPFDFILITFPKEVVLPKNLTCTSTSGQLLLKTSKCSHSKQEPNSVMIELFNGDKLSVLEAFNIRINNVTNPNTTRPTVPIKVVVYDSNEFTRPTAKDPDNLIVTTVIPFTVPASSASMTRTNTGAGQSTDYILSMKLSHPIKQTGGLLIKYPP